jgi:hypothetical protein
LDSFSCVNDEFVFKISEKDFNSFYAIQFHGAQQKRKYLLHVDAKIKGMIPIGNE